MRFIITFLYFFLFISPSNVIFADNKPDTSHNEVEGLKLPPSQEVNYDEGFITLTAECKGTVKWLVLSTSAKVKFKVNNTTPNEIDIAIPPYESGITVFAIGLVDNKLTEYARTDIIIKGPAPPDPNPNPPNPNVVEKPLHFTIIEDPTKRTTSIKNVIESLDLRTKLTNKEVIFRVFTHTDPIASTPGFKASIEKYGLPLIVLQDKNGKGLVIGKLPNTVEEVLKYISPFVGGF